MTTTEIPAFHAIEGLLSRLEYLQALQDGSGIVQLRLNRPAKRNAANDQLIAELHTAFINLPRDARGAARTHRRHPHRGSATAPRPPEARPPRPSR